MRNIFRIGCNLAVVFAGFCLAPELHAQVNQILRLMPRINVGNADAAVSADVLRGWESAAGFSLRSATRTRTGAWAIDVPPDVSAGRVKLALDVLRGDPEILWIDDKAMPQRGGAAATAGLTSHLAVRTRNDSAAAAMFSPGMTGSIPRRVFEAAAVHESVGYTVERLLPTGHALCTWTRRSAWRRRSIWLRPSAVRLASCMRNPWVGRWRSAPRTIRDT
ncbi:MAG: hypothetical protein IPI73_15430 [Betaproteobacteria bacterium]|nr:hypothetical protein [Betaproteobacteria bacterium]